MSSRFTAPVSKLTRSFSTSAPIARPSHLFSNASKSATAAGRKSKPYAGEQIPEDAARHHSTSTSPHRPSLAAQQPPRIIPFMQTFHHSAPKPAAPSFPTIDSAVLPSLHEEESSDYDPYAHIRVPLLPDNTTPPPIAFRQPEAADAPLPQAQISIVAANPEQVLPSPLTEVEGMTVDGVELGFAHLLGLEEDEARDRYDEMGSGMIRDLWKGLMDDVFGEKAGSSGGGVKGGPAAA
ncbi:hypothetical protein VTK26DRAFT_3439 [Humicola hyalothermophila]